MTDEQLEITRHLIKESRSAEETSRIASEFSKKLSAGDTVAFYGDLGSGKTFFITALCHALGVNQSVTSPTFTILNEYYAENFQLIYHFDFYRLESPAELQNLGLEEFFYSDYICLIEWAGKIEDFLPPDRWEITLDFVSQKPEARKIKISRRHAH